MRSFIRKFKKEWERKAAKCGFYTSDFVHHTKPINPIVTAAPASIRGSMPWWLNKVLIEPDWLIQSHTKMVRHTTAATIRMTINGRSIVAFSCCFFRICARHQINPGLGSSG